MAFPNSLGNISNFTFHFAKHVLCETGNFYKTVLNVNIVFLKNPKNIHLKLYFLLWEVMTKENILKKKNPNDKRHLNTSKISSEM